MLPQSKAANFPLSQMCAWLASWKGILYSSVSYNRLLSFFSAIHYNLDIALEDPYLVLSGQLDSQWNEVTKLQTAYPVTPGTLACRCTSSVGPWLCPEEWSSISFYACVLTIPASYRLIILHTNPGRNILLAVNNQVSLKKQTGKPQPWSNKLFILIERVILPVYSFSQCSFFLLLSSIPVKMVLVSLRLVAQLCFLCI